ncbi:uncharacterized protein LOC122264550 isoform X2 [Penaeus japonicus]|uniref:uncharacterized protein LOC122264550 isoform X2 n=1 Tax=Penaeus japonicus TaxID=27405 RepID=UPI001C715805|nr:uncharacterized protein LOC122264550 isoform X2 [Penaeus japonicus]
MPFLQMYLFLIMLKSTSGLASYPLRRSACSVASRHSLSRRESFSTSGRSRDQSTRKEDQKQDFKWLWPVYKEMEFYIAGHNAGSKQTGCVCRYNTKKPLKMEHLLDALKIFQRKLPNYRVFAEKREGGVWACQALDPPIDFKVLEGADVHEMMTQMMTIPISSDRPPLWSARLIPVPEDAPCCLPEVKAAFPHQYDFVFLPHHAISDGNTMTVTLRSLTKLLDDVIAGKNIEDEEPIGLLGDYKEVEDLDAAIIREMEKEPGRLHTLMEEALACDTMPVILKAFPPPGGKPATRCVLRNVEEEVLSRFRTACKANGVSFNSGMEALVNTAIVEMVRDAGVEGESHSISINLATDLRRYMKRRPLPILGLFVRPTVHRVETPVNVRGHFWDYTKKLHQKVSGLLASSEALRQDVVRRMTLPAVSAEEYYAGPPLPLRDYGLTNLGDFTRIIPGVGEHLQLTNITMFAAIHLSVYMMLHQIYTFRGYSPYTLSYDTSYMSEHTANILADAVLELMTNFGRS